MANVKLGARAGTTCAAVMLAATMAAAQSYPAQSRVRPNKGSHPDSTPSATSDAAKTPQSTTITGCVVRDAANGGSPTIKSDGISYKLASKADDGFAQYLGKRVEVTGLLDSGSTTPRATSGKTDDIGKSADSVAPKGQTAVGGQSDVTTTGTARDNTVPPADEAGAVARDSVPLATDKGTTADLTGRLDVKTIRTVSGNCF